MTETSRSIPEKPQRTARGDLLAVLPLRDIVVFPHMIVPLFVGREKSVRALEAVMKEDKQILLVSQKNATQDDPSVDDIYRVGTVSTILQLLKLPDGTVKAASAPRSPASRKPSPTSKPLSSRCPTPAPTVRTWRRWAAAWSPSSNSTSS